MGFDIGVTYPLFCLKALSESVKSAEIQDIPISLLSTRERTIEDLAFRRPPATAGHSELIKLRVISTSHLLIFFYLQNELIELRTKNEGQEETHTLVYFFYLCQKLIFFLECLYQKSVLQFSFDYKSLFLCSTHCPLPQMDRWEMASRNLDPTQIALKFYAAKLLLISYSQLVWLSVLPSIKAAFIMNSSQLFLS